MLHYAGLLKKSDNFSRIVKTNSNEDPVTLADIKVNELIIKRIKQKYIGINWEILSEENVKNSPDLSEMKSNFVWVLDPLDGTRDFIQGTDNYAMHLALNYNHKPILGVVLIPAKDELWITDGSHTWCERRNGEKFKPNFSDTKNLLEMVLVKSKNHKNSTLEELIKKINVKNEIEMGSIGCKIASLIRGESDIYVSLSLPNQTSPKDWDFAAPEAILRIAGGAITNLNNEELKFNRSNFEQKGIIIASNNKQNHKNLCSQIKEIIKKYDLYPLSFN